jgi:hypothetical protein
VRQGKDLAMEGLTPASADDLPPLGELIVDDRSGSTGLGPAGDFDRCKDDQGPDF